MLFVGSGRKGPGPFVLACLSYGLPLIFIIAPLASDDANLAVNHPDHVVAGENGNYYFRMSGTSSEKAGMSIEKASPRSFSIW